MAFAIDPDECIVCGACEPVCPTQAISHTANTYIINAKSCSECQGFYDVAQCVVACPTDCIQPIAPVCPLQSAKRAKLYQQVVRLFEQTALDS